jgi:hypothetical protein
MSDDTAPPDRLPPNAVLRRGYHDTHKIYLGGGKIGNDWQLSVRYHYFPQRCDEKYTTKIEKTQIDKRYSSMDTKFNGTFDDVGDKELDKDQFVQALKHRVRDHGLHLSLRLENELLR